MDTIYFATGNKGKIREAEKILGRKLKGISLDVEEIQSLDPIKVTVNKAREYFKIVRKPLFVEDGSLVFMALKNLPGTYINDFWDTLGNGGLIKLLNNYQDKTAVAQVTLVFKENEKDDEIFTGKVIGEVSDKPKGAHGFGWDQIFIPRGSNKTFAQMSLVEKNKYSMRAKAFKKFKLWLVKNGKIAR